MESRIDISKDIQAARIDNLSHDLDGLPELLRQLEIQIIGAMRCVMLGRLHDAPKHLDRVWKAHKKIKKLIIDH